MEPTDTETGKHCVKLAQHHKQRMPAFEQKEIKTKAKRTDS